MKTYVTLIMMLISNVTYCESVYKCNVDGQYKYQQTPCPSASVEASTIDVSASFTPDPATLARLEQQRLVHLKKSNPTAYESLRRSQLTPTERNAEDLIAVEKLKQEQQEEMVEALAIQSLKMDQLQATAQRAAREAREASSAALRNSMDLQNAQTMRDVGLNH